MNDEKVIAEAAQPQPVAEPQPVFDSVAQEKWFYVNQLARRLHGQGEKITPGSLKESLGLDQAEWMQALTYAKRNDRESWMRLYEMMNRKPPEPRAPREDDPELETDQVGDIDSEEITDQDALNHVLSSLTGFDQDSKTRILSTAAVFLGIDFVSIGGASLVTSRPRPGATRDCRDTAGPSDALGDK